MACLNLSQRDSLGVSGERVFDKWLPNIAWLLGFLLQGMLPIFFQKKTIFKKKL